MSKIVEELRKWGAIKVGEPIPAELGGSNGWGAALTKLLNEAADRIEYLEARAGSVSQGDGDFRTIARNEPKQSDA